MSNSAKLTKLQKQNSDDIKNLGAAFALRLATIFYAQFHDYFFHVRYRCFVIYKFSSFPGKLYRHRLQSFFRGCYLRFQRAISLFKPYLPI